MGDIADEDADRFAEFADDDSERPTECERCGTGGLFWEEDNGGYVLIDTKGKVHRCAAKTEAEGFFGVVG